MKRTYQPKKQRRARRHGFRHRMQTRAGRAVLRSRRQKGRARLDDTIVPGATIRLGVPLAHLA